MFGMGTTLVALAVVERQDGTNGLTAAHIGDSRLYVYRDGVLKQVTVDHSLVQELVDDGQISEAQAAVHPQRHVLTRALGVEPAIEVDIIELAPRHGDRYLLCSDGLPREVSDDQIAAVLSRFPNPVEAANELVAVANLRGGNDNITVVVIDVLASDNSPDTMIVVPHPTVTGPTSAVPAPPKAAVPRRARKGPAPKRVTLRVVVFLVAICIVVGGAIACLGWYGRSAYYVGLSKDRITIFQGRPGGVLWFQPTVVERTRDTPRPCSPTASNSLKPAKLSHPWRRPASTSPTWSQRKQRRTGTASPSRVEAPTTSGPLHGHNDNSSRTGADELGPELCHHDGGSADNRRMRALQGWRGQGGAEAIPWQLPARRRTELGMIILVFVLTGGFYALSNLGQAGALPTGIIPFLVLVFVLMLVAHLSLRWLAPQADPVLLPLAALLNGIGYVFIAGLNHGEASAQAVWTGVGVTAFVVTLAICPRAINLERSHFRGRGGGHGARPFLLCALCALGGRSSFLDERRARENATAPRAPPP